MRSGKPTSQQQGTEVQPVLESGDVSSVETACHLLLDSRITENLSRLMFQMFALLNFMTDICNFYM